MITASAVRSLGAAGHRRVLYAAIQTVPFTSRANASTITRSHHIFEHINLPSVSYATTLLPSARTYSSSPKLQQTDGERKWTLLYNRNPSRTTVPRAMLGVTTFNLTYWFWYNLDFIPSINASAHHKFELGQIDADILDKLLIEPALGYMGMGISSLIWLGAYLYTKQLVSAIWASKETALHGDGACQLAVSTLKLPLLTRPKILAKTVYDPESNHFGNAGEIVFTDSELKSESSVEFYEPRDLALSEKTRRNDVITKYDGEFSKLNGHISLKKTEEGNKEDGGPLSSVLKQKYLLDVASEDEFMPNSNPILLHSLVLEDYHLQSAKKVLSKKVDKVEDNGVKVPVERTNIGASVKRKGGFRRKRR